jgi:non-specific serine/threonine protein kinase
LSVLVDHSIVQPRAGDGAPRFTMLQTIQAFGRDRLVALGEEATARQSHAEYVHRAVLALEPWLLPHLPDSDRILGQLEVEYPNLRAALIWCQETGDAEGLLELAGALAWFWVLRGHALEGQVWLNWGLDHANPIPESIRARSQYALSCIASFQRNQAITLALAEESARYFSAAGAAPMLARAYELAASASIQVGGSAEAARLIDRALATLRSLKTKPWAQRAYSHVMFQRGVLAKDAGDLAASARILREVIERQRELVETSGQEYPYACLPHLAIGAVHQIEGEAAAALSHYQRSLSLAWRFHVAICVAQTVTRIAGMLAAIGRWQEAAWMLGATEAYAETHGFEFTDRVWMLTRAFGLPQPWQGPEDFVGQPADIRAEIHRRSLSPLPPLPDPAAAARLWAAGRRVPIEDAVAHAAEVSLTRPSELRPLRVVANLDGDLTAVTLTPREHEILAMLCQRLTNAEIADQLYLSRRTVEDHISRLLGKLGVTNRREAAAAAVQLGLVSHQSARTA